jgi:hypothetical protein
MWNDEIIYHKAILMLVLKKADGAFGALHRLYDILKGNNYANYLC